MRPEGGADRYVLERQGTARVGTGEKGRQPERSVTPFAVAVPGRWRPIDDTVAVEAPACDAMRFPPLVVTFDLVAGEAIQLIAVPFLNNQPSEEGGERRDSRGEKESESARDSPVHVGPVPGRGRSKRRRVPQLWSPAAAKQWR